MGRRLTGRSPRPVLGPLFEDQQLEWRAQSDMQERGRRLTAFKEATVGKVLVEIEPGDWQYVAPSAPRFGSTI